MTSKAKVCRICMLGNTKGVISLFAVCNGSDRIYNKIMQVANIQISIQDGLPTWICYSCLVHLETSYQFKIQAEKSDQLLRKQLESTNKEELDVVVIDNQVNPLQKQSQLRGLLSKPKTSDACVGTAFRPKNDEVLFKEQQNDIQGHFMSEVCEGISLTDNEQNGIKITNVVSHAQPETLEGCSIEADNAQTLSEEAICTCAKNTDGSKCDTCKKISSERAMDEDINNCTNHKTNQKEETTDDLFMLNMSKPFIELAQSGRNETSKQTSLLDMSGDNNNTPIDKPVGRINMLIIRKIDDSTKADSNKLLGSSFIAIISPQVEIEAPKVYEKKKFKQQVSQKTYNCPNCKEIYTTRKVLNKHILTAHRGTKGYKCSICDKSYILKEYLSIHLTCHEKNKNFKCNDCGESFSRRFQLSNHKKCKHSKQEPVVCEYCGRDFKGQSGLQRHQLIYHSKDAALFVCDVCGKSFITKSYLNSHFVMHNKQNLACTICKKIYPHKRALKAHQYNMHSKIPRTSTCTMCGKQFKNKSTLNRHIQHKHRNREKPKCHICNATFSQKVGLQTHMKIIHIGLTPHACKHCKLEFRWKQTCEKHERRCLDKQNENKESTSKLIRSNSNNKESSPSATSTN